MPQSTAIICSRGKRPIVCKTCGRPGSKLCDARVKAGGIGRARTCDEPMCDLHAHRIGPNEDLCERHFKQEAGG